MTPSRHPQEKGRRAETGAPRAKVIIPLAVRLERNSIPEPNSGCLLWLGAVDRWGYPRLGVGLRTARRSLGAHRVAYETANGPIPPGLFVLHKCDVPSCVNAAHLFVGTHQENMSDMVAKARHCRGERAPNVKLTSEQVRAIRRDTRRAKDIAQAYGMSRNGISDIRTRKNWAHVEDAST